MGSVCVSSTEEVYTVKVMSLQPNGHPTSYWAIYFDESWLVHCCWKNLKSKGQGEWQNQQKNMLSFINRWG